MFARFDENPEMTLQDIKKTKRYGRTHARTHTRTHAQRENSIPITNKVCGGYKYPVSDTNIKFQTSKFVKKFISPLQKDKFTETQTIKWE